MLMDEGLVVEPRNMQSPALPRRLLTYLDSVVNNYPAYLEYVFPFIHSRIRINANMLGKSILELFCLKKPEEKLFPCRNQPTRSNEADVSQSNATNSHQHPMRHLPHTVITSDLGYRDHKFKLQFNRFLAEDPSIAVFSIDQEAPVSSTWRDERSRNNCRLNSRYGRTRLLITGRSHCNASITVGQGWSLGVSIKGIRYWNAEDGVLLVDWSQIYADYFAQAQKRLKKGKGEKVVEVDRCNERKALGSSEPEGAGNSHGDLGIFPVTRQDNDDNFRCTSVQHELQVVNGAVRKQVDERWKIHKRVEAFVCSPGPLWRSSGYQRLG